jgi:hypothetical protein
MILMENVFPVEKKRIFADEKQKKWNWFLNMLNYGTYIRFDKAVFLC